MNDRPHYPWSEGDQLFAAELNAAIANAAGIGGQGGPINAIAMGADPTGVVDSSDAINEAASQVGPDGHRMAVYLPTGTYLIRKQIVLTDGQSFFGDGQGSTTLLVRDDFDPTAASVLWIGNTTLDPGPTIRDLRISFAQPSDVVSRSTFKTLAAGGTSHTGGTGVQYPWVISQPSSGGTGRVNILRVRIEAAWNGITDNGNSGLYWVDGLQICAINCGFDLGSVGVFDWTHWTDIEFWPFGFFLVTGQNNIWKDGQTVAMRLGQVNGLVAQNISCFYAKIIITANATDGWFQFTNLSMDGDGATISVLACFFLQFANLYSTCGSAGTAPAISTVGATAVRTISISNWYAHTASPFPFLDMSGGGDVSVVNAYLIPQVITANAFRVTAGHFRLSNSKIYPANASAWTVPLIYQDNTGSVQLDNVDLQGNSPGGVAVQFNTDLAFNISGFVTLGPGWTSFASARVNGQYGPYAPTDSPTFTGLITLNGGVPGMSFGAAADTAPDVFSKHLTLFDPGYGIGVTAGRINYVVSTPVGAHGFRINGSDVFYITAGQIDCHPTTKFFSNVGFNGSSPVPKPTITGSRAGNAALASLLTQLVAYGLVTDGTTA